MPANAPDDEETARVVKFLRAAGLEPVLIGGMAMTVHGSTRATMDCDYALEKTDSAIKRAARAMFEAGYGLIFGWDSEKYKPLPDGVKADDSAVGRAVVERPESLWFWNAARKIRIDLVFDIPVPMEELRSRATRLSIAGQRILLASPEDLLRMKEVSAAAREDEFRRISDEQDLVFLRGLLELRKKNRS